MADRRDHPRPSLRTPRPLASPRQHAPGTCRGPCVAGTGRASRLLSSRNTCGSSARGSTPTHEWSGVRRSTWHRGSRSDRARRCRPHRAPRGQLRYRLLDLKAAHADCDLRLREVRDERFVVHREIWAVRQAIWDLSAYPGLDEALRLSSAPAQQRIEQRPYPALIDAGFCSEFWVRTYLARATACRSEPSRAGAARTPVTITTGTPMLDPRRCPNSSAGSRSGSKA